MSQPRIALLSLGLSSNRTQVQCSECSSTYKRPLFAVLFSLFSRVCGAVPLAARIPGKARSWCLNAALV